MISRLKSLELQGYKTFANRTVFQFPGAVTAIVGPNGSGKSNITDALRWVLGEQSYSLLRGKKTEDMIFSGSDRRTRSGMATATVILDNNDNWLPIDFAEVAVTRRAYRDGSNEYLLNDQRVRLRDVSELLAESGLAERTYTIIGQGLVDAALALRAEDRRRLFEEAAGIGLHRSRREDAVRRLKNTNRNLERVNDILTELRPRLRSLERQARRAEDYELAVSNVRTLLKEWYGYHWHRAQTELSEAQGKLHETESVLEGIRQKAERFGEEIAELREIRQSLRGELNDYHQKSSALHSEMEIASRDLAITEERIQNTQSLVSQIDADMAHAKTDVGLLVERCAFAEKEVERINLELQEADARCSEINEKKERRQQERAAIKARLENARKELVNVAAERSDNLARLAERSAQLDQIDKSIETLGADFEILMGDLDSRKADIDQGTDELHQLTSLINDLRNKKGKIQNRAQKMGVEIERLEQQLGQKRAEQAKILAEYEVIQDAKRTFAGYSEGAKVLLEERLGSSQGILGGKIQVSREFEIAIGAAIGEFAEAIILEDQAEIESALSILETKSQKAAIIPLSARPIMEISSVQLNHELIIGSAVDFVTSSEELKPVIELLLRNTYIVEDRQSAQICLDTFHGKKTDGKDPEFRIVTLNGELFHFGGPITTSASRKPVSIRRRRLEKENVDRQQAISKEIKELELSISGVNADLAALENEEQQVNLRLVEQEKDLHDQQDAHNQKRNELHRIQREIKWHEGKIFELKNDKDDIAIQIDQMAKKSSIIGEKAAKLEEKLSDDAELLQSTPIGELEADSAHWTTRLAVLKQTLSASILRLEEQTTRLDQARENLKGLGENRDKATADLEALEENVVQLRQVINAKTEKIESFRSFILPSEKELDQVEQKIADLLSHESQERVISSQAEQKYTQAKISQVRKQEALDALRKRIEMDFGLVTFDYLDDVSGPIPLPINELVEELPVVHELPGELERDLNRQKSLLRRIGPINQEAQQEFIEVSERFEFLTSQVDDLQEAIADLNQVIEELDEIMEREFCNTFEAVAAEFHLIFSRLFGGGSARLVLTDPDELTDTGIDIEARLPGRREQGLSLLSGGERSLTAVALVFALLRVSPTPFCVLDEVDAMLDEANVGRFRELLRELSETTQFIMITHNRATVQVADIIYGVTMGKDSTSQILSLKVDEVEKVV